MGDTPTALLVGVIVTIIGQIATFGTLVFNARQLRFEAERKRKWEIEDRALLAAKVVAVGDTLAAKVDQQHIEVSAAIAENTEKTDQAIKVSQEANHLSRKIAELARAYDKVQGRTTALEDRDDAPATAAAASSAASATLVKDLVEEQKEVVADQKVVLGEQKEVLDDQKIVLEKQLKKAK